MLAAIAVGSLAFRQAWRRMSLTERWRKKRKRGDLVRPRKRD
jgi:hypothetical protein